MVRTFSGGTVNIPTAFTPNADGLNDVFYLLASPDVEIVKDFSVFNRWGEKVFQVNSVPPNDPNFGWNGYFKSVHAPAGAYVYQATIRFTDGKEQFFKGTVVLIR
jgi:gliding motility-associated-like protein